jgi:hypothetical protein
MNYYCVVYQMGKVASTSIMDTLGHVDGIEAVQCHFLGDTALGKMIPTLTDAGLSEYFFEHSFGQFQENVKITRKFKILRSGGAPETKLLVVSLARDPIDWIRSSVVQDIKGYMPVLKQIIEASFRTAATDEEVVTKGLRLLISASCHVLDQFGGIDEFYATPHAMNRAFQHKIFCDIFEARRMFLMLLRPADWFNSHFKTAINLDIATMDRVEDAWEHSENHTDFVVVRYEDFRRSLPAYLQRKGIADIDHFTQKNLSESKLLSKEVARVFASENGDALRKIYNKTTYSKTFGYAPAPDTP